MLRITSSWWEGTVWERHLRLSSRLNLLIVHGFIIKSTFNNRISSALLKFLGRLLISFIEISVTSEVRRRLDRGSFLGRLSILASWFRATRFCLLRVFCQIVQIFLIVIRISSFELRENVQFPILTTQSIVCFVIIHETFVNFVLWLNETLKRWHWHISSVQILPTGSSQFLLLNSVPKEKLHFFHSLFPNISLSICMIFDVRAIWAHLIIAAIAAFTLIDQLAREFSAHVKLTSRHKAVELSVVGAQSLNYSDDIKFIVDFFLTRVD